MSNSIEEKKIKKILVVDVGWVYSGFTDNTDDDDSRIEVFFIIGEMALVPWYRKGKHEFNGKYVIQIVYE